MSTSSAKNQNHFPLAFKNWSPSPKPAQHPHLEVLEKVFSFQSQAHSFSMCFQRFMDQWAPRGSDFTDMSKWTLDPMALRPGLEKPSWVSPLDLCECAVTGTSETFYNAALNPGAWMTCFSEGKGGRHDYVSRGSWHDLIHESFFYLCPGNLPLQNSKPHMVVCLILLILNLCLLLGTKCDILPGFCILPAYLLHNGQEE